MRRVVTYKAGVGASSGAVEVTEDKPGLFHGFSSEGQKVGEIGQTQPVALIEFEDGSVVSKYLHQFKFIKDTEQDAHAKVATRSIQLYRHCFGFPMGGAEHLHTCIVMAIKEKEQL